MVDMCEILKFAEDVFMIKHKYIRLEYTVPNTFKFSKSIDGYIKNLIYLEFKFVYHSETSQVR